LRYIDQVDYTPAIEAFKTLKEFFEQLQAEQEGKKKRKGRNWTPEQKATQRLKQKQIHAKKKQQVAHLKQLAEQSPIAKPESVLEPILQGSPNPKKKSALEAALDSIVFPDVTGIPDKPGTEKAMEAPKSQEHELHDLTEQLQAMHTQPERDGSRDPFVRTPPSKPVQSIVEWDANDPRLK
jgi:hypothetical protein